MINFTNITSVKNRNLLKEMVRADFKLRYQNSVLGYLWSLLKPLMLFGILYIVFSKFLRFGDKVPHFAVSLLLGVVMWTFFIEATKNSLNSIVKNGSLIRKISIPKYLIVVANVASSTINLLLNLVVVVVFIVFSHTDIGVSALLFPLLLVELFIFTLAVGFFLSAVFVKFRDITYIWDVVLQGMFYLIPIIYPLNFIPYDTAQKIIMTNPVAQIIQDSRAVLTYSGTTQVYDIFSGLYWVMPFAVVFISLVVASVYFRKRSRFFAEDI